MTRGTRSFVEAMIKLKYGNSSKLIDPTLHDSVEPQSPMGEAVEGGVGNHPTGPN